MEEEGRRSVGRMGRFMLSYAGRKKRPNHSVQKRRATTHNHCNAEAVGLLRSWRSARQTLEKGFNPSCSKRRSHSTAVHMTESVLTLVSFHCVNFILKPDTPGTVVICQRLSSFEGGGNSS